MRDILLFQVLVSVLDLLKYLFPTRTYQNGNGTSKTKADWNSNSGLHKHFCGKFAVFSLHPRDRLDMGLTQGETAFVYH